eukprot:15121419-Alexandrium_andersonii.AAC.1
MGKASGTRQSEGSDGMAQCRAARLSLTRTTWARRAVLGKAKARSAPRSADWRDSARHLQHGQGAQCWAKGRLG